MSDDILKGLWSGTRVSDKLKQRRGTPPPPEMPKIKPKPKAPGPLAGVAKTEKKVAKKAAGGLWKRAVTRGFAKQAALGGGRAATGAILAGVPAFASPIAVAADLALIGAAAYTGGKALMAHRELQRMKKSSEEKYGTVEKAIRTRREMNRGK